MVFWTDGDSSDESMEHFDSNTPMTIEDSDFEGPVENEEALFLCYHLKIAKKLVAFEGNLTGRRFHGCGPELGKCGFIHWVDKEWPEAMKMALQKLWGKYEECNAARTQKWLDHADVVLKLQDKIKQLHLQYTNLVADLNKILDQQVQRTYQENYHKIMTEDSEALEKKRYIITNLKAIHLVQGEVIRNRRKETHELKQDKDGLKKEMHLVKSEIHDLKKDKNQLTNDKLEVMKERDELKKDKKLEYDIADLLKVGEIHKSKLKKIKGICEEDDVIELSG